MKTKRQDPYPSLCTVGGTKSSVKPLSSLLIKYLIFLASSIHTKLDFRHLELKVIDEKCAPIFKMQPLDKHSPGIVLERWPSSSADLVSSNEAIYCTRVHAE